MSFEPLTGWRRVEVTERRRKREFAQQMRRIAEEDYPQASKIRIVLDNLSTHTPAAFHEAFDPEQARLLTRRVEFCYTPVHGSWLNMAEIEISALVRQCLTKAEASGRGGAQAGGEGMGNGTQPFGGERGLALHHTRSPHQATEPLPGRETVTAD
jgi:hypothetical protein